LDTPSYNGVVPSIMEDAVTDEESK